MIIRPPKPGDEAVLKSALEAVYDMKVTMVHGGMPPQSVNAENPNSFFPGVAALPIPQAAVPDF